jgi:hypothetical protein
MNLCEGAVLVFCGNSKCVCVCVSYFPLHGNLTYIWKFGLDTEHVIIHLYDDYIF